MTGIAIRIAASDWRIGNGRWVVATTTTNGHILADNAAP